MTLTILSLPGELLLQIFRHLSYPDLLSAGQVSRQWREVSEDSLLLQGIALYCTVLYCTGERGQPPAAGDSSQGLRPHPLHRPGGLPRRAAREGVIKWI